jgi:hypothetical protein
MTNSEGHNIQRRQQIRQHPGYQQCSSIATDVVSLAQKNLHFLAWQYSWPPKGSVRSPQDELTSSNLNFQKDELNCKYRSLQGWVFKPQWETKQLTYLPPLGNTAADSWSWDLWWQKRAATHFHIHFLGWSAQKLSPRLWNMNISKWLHIHRYLQLLCKSQDITTQNHRSVEQIMMAFPS